LWSEDTAAADNFVDEAREVSLSPCYCKADARICMGLLDCNDIVVDGNLGKQLAVFLSLLTSSCLAISNK